jgi:uncharacterized protein (DUF488 family)
MRLYTIGHSTRSLEELVALLREHGIKTLVDVRRWPSSKHSPHFNRENLEKKLSVEGIRYEWLGESLGGYRRQGLGEDSPNKAWRSRGFRNYADHTLTEGFTKGVEKLLGLAEQGRVVYMCAEKYYWSCHRRIISDYLKVKGHQITNIIEKGETREHELTAFAEIKGGVLRYPARRQG